MTVIEIEGRDLTMVSSIISRDISLQMTTYCAEERRAIDCETDSINQLLEDKTVGYVNFPGLFNQESSV